MTFLFGNIEIFEKNFLRENDCLVRKLFIASLSLEIIRLLEQTSQIISEKIQKENFKLPTSNCRKDSSSKQNFARDRFYFQKKTPTFDPPKPV